MAANWRDTANRYAALVDEHERQMQARFGHIPMPDDAIDTPSPWIEWDDGVFARGYTAWRGRAAGFEVVVDAWQFSDGRPTHREIVYTDCNRGTDLTAARARELAAALVEAATVLERLSDAGDKVAVMSTVTAERWAEISTLDGESVLLIMERTDPDERPDVLIETPINIDPEQDSAYVDVAAELAALGYREVGQRVYTDYGCALGIAAQ